MLIPIPCSRWCMFVRLLPGLVPPPMIAVPLGLWMLIAGRWAWERRRVEFLKYWWWILQVTPAIFPIVITWHTAGEFQVQEARWQALEGAFASSLVPAHL